VDERRRSLSHRDISETGGQAEWSSADPSRKASQIAFYGAEQRHGFAIALHATFANREEP
jgi:hypothetical protein